MTTIHIRDYKESDWSEVCAVHDAARPQEVAGVMPPGTFLPMTEAAYDEDFFEGRQLVAVEGGPDGRVVGFVAYNGNWITWVYVHPDAQGRGIGRLMMEHVLPLVGPDAVLTALTTNTAAIAFYERVGLVQAAVMPGDCEGYRCDITRMCLPGSQYRDRYPQPVESSLLLAGYSAENWGHAERDEQGVWRWMA